MVYIDTHAHLDWNSFDSDREQLVKDMKSNNVIALTNTINYKNYMYTKGLFESNSDVVKVCPGLYPEDAQNISDEDFEEYLGIIKQEKDKFVLIGEVGLDKKYGDTEELFAKQVSRFRRIIELAIELDKPLSIHTRKAEIEVLNILREYVEKYKFTKFILHCFSGKKRLISEIKELKIYCSIPLIVLNTQSFRMLVEEMPISKLLAETDSPFLNPSKERNSSLNIPRVYEEIANIKGLDKIEIENIIYRNYVKLIM
ncbi:MAG: TatD family hydrolase [Candidatus Woesearchaeota archaeon]|jgi:TatD DNase family protein|nr:TatD family hydrolase [Candidatus Woesearchaeota archaeon]